MSDAPIGWSQKQIRDVCRLVAGFAFPLHHQGKRGLYPFFKVSDMNARGNEVWLSYAENEVDAQTLQTLKAKVYPRGTIVFPKVGAALLTNKRRILGCDGLFDNNVMGLIPDNIDGNFLFQLMQRLDFRDLVQPGAVPSVNATMVGGIQILLPPLAEQRKIAAILSSVDDTIAKTQAVIDQLEVVKKGLLGELMMQGMPGRHLEFRETSIGRIPAGWELATIADVGKVVTGSTPSTKNPAFWGGNIPFVTPGDLGGARVIHTTERTVTDKGANAGRLLPVGTVFVTCIASIGKSGIANVPCITNQQINAVICNTRTTPEFIYYFISSSIERLKSIAGTTAVPIISKSRFEHFELPLPPKDEQVQIASALTSIDDAISSNRAIIAQQVSLKAGLLDVLLSGRVRVSAPTEETA